eukprot:10462462-Alexandrium_andersonii.AAC.1
MQSRERTGLRRCGRCLHWACTVVARTRATLNTLSCGHAGLSTTRKTCQARGGGKESSRQAQ